MLKRFIAVLSAASVLGGVTVSARLVSETTSKPDGWSIAYNGNAGASNVTYRLDGENFFSGATSLNIGTILGVGEGSAVAEYILPEGMESGTYTFSFCMKGTYATNAVYAGVAATFAPKNLIRRFESADMGDGWTKYSSEISYTGEKKIKFQFSKGCDNAYIDDVSFVKDGEEFAQNGGFEILKNTTITNIVTDPAEDNPSLCDIEVVADEHMPSNVMATPTDGKLTLSWKNPSKAAMKITLYEVKGDTDFEIASDFETASSAYVKYKADNRGGVYKIVSEFTDGEVTEYVISGNTLSEITVPNWNISYNYGADGFPFGTWIDVTEKHGAAASFRLSSNASAYADGSVVLTQDTNLSAGEVYALYAWRKAENASDVAVTYGGNKLTGKVIKTDDDGWECLEYRIEFAEKTNNTLAFTFEKGFDEIYLDDIELYKYTDGILSGDNLISNGDFEDSVSAETAVSPEATAEALENSVKIIPGNIAEGQTAEIYVKSVDGYSKCGEITGAVNSVKLGNLEAETLYGFAIVTKCAELNDSRATLVSATPLPPVITIGRVSVTKISDTAYRVSRTVSNNRLEAEYGAELIAALVEDGVITKIVSGGAVKLDTGDSETLTLDITAEGAVRSKTEIRVYTWDSFSGLRIRTPFEAYPLSGI